MTRLLLAIWVFSNAAFASDERCPRAILGTFNATLLQGVLTELSERPGTRQVVYEHWMSKHRIHLVQAFPDTPASQAARTALHRHRNPLLPWTEVPAERKGVRWLYVVGALAAAYGGYNISSYIDPRLVNGVDWLFPGSKKDPAGILGVLNPLLIGVRFSLQALLPASASLSVTEWLSIKRLNRFRAGTAQTVKEMMLQGKQHPEVPGLVLLLTPTQRIHKRYLQLIHEMLVKYEYRPLL